MGRFCARCGSGSGEYIHGLCGSCYWKEIEMRLPSDLVVTMCPECRSHLQGKRWVRLGEIGDEDWKAIVAAESELERKKWIPEQVTIDTTSGDVLERDDKGLPKTVLLHITLKEKEKANRHNTSLLASIEYSDCNTCTRLARKEHEAVVQIRVAERAFDHEDQLGLEEAISSFSKKAFKRQRGEIVEIKEKEGGYDIKFATLTTARIFAKRLHEELGARVQESPKLVGVDRRTGGRVYKNTISAKIPKYRAGEFVSFRGNIYRIIGYDRGRMVVEDLDGGRHKALGENDSDEVEGLVENQIKRIRLDGRTGGHADLFDLEETRFIEVPSDVVPPEMKIGEEGLLVNIAGKEKVVRTRKTRAL